MFIIRRVRSREDLAVVSEVLGAQFSPPIPPTDRRLTDLVPRFDQDRALMLVAERDGAMVGGALGFRGGAGMTLRIIAVQPPFRHIGLGTRLVQALEVEAMRLGVRAISLGADEARDFYRTLGYTGGARMHKELPLPGGARERRLTRWLAALDDLDAGHRAACSTSTGKIARLY